MGKTSGYLSILSIFLLSGLFVPSFAFATTGADGTTPFIADGPGVFLRYSDYPADYPSREELDPADIASSEILHGYDALSADEPTCKLPPFSIGDTEGEITAEFMSPLIVHSLDCADPVEKNIKVFSNPLKERFGVWLQRSGRYVPLMKDIFREKGLPEDLVYIALVESGFNPKAYSRARACGPWQFISGTGKKYGLKYDYWVDERRDPVKSTIAAANYLTDLYNMFGTWSLAMASYNAGEGRVARAVRSHGTLDFWELREKRALARETREYVPRFLAAKAIAKNPEAYGFEGIVYDSPLEFDTVKIDVPISLDVAAKCAGVSADEIKALNPELRRWCTPPDTPGYELKVPRGKSEMFMAAFDKLPDSEKAGWSEYVVRRGDTLGAIAGRYNVPVSLIAKTNNIRRVSSISIGQRLVIPAPDAKAVSYTASSDFDDPSYEDGGTSWYKVRRGDTLSRIAGRFRMPLGKLASLNGISTRATIFPGQRLRVSGSAPSDSYASAPSGKSTASYRVRSGDTLWEIAQKHGMSLSQLTRLNGISTRSTIRPGQKLKVYASSGGSSGPSREFASIDTTGGLSYRVRQGDTIWDIARKHGVSVDSLLKANSLHKRSVIKPGQTLQIPGGGSA